MQKLITFLCFLCVVTMQAQYNNNDHQWSIELNTGFTKPFRTMSPTGYQTTDPALYHIDLGAKYTLSPTVALKADVAFDSFKNKVNWPEFKSKYTRFDFQAVVDLGYVFWLYDEPDPFGFYVHSGFGVSNLTTDASSYKDKMVNGIFGFTGTYQISSDFALSADISALMHLHQNRTFDGRTENESYSRFTGNMLTSTVGIIYFIPN